MSIDALRMRVLDLEKRLTKLEQRVLVFALLGSTLGSSAQPFLTHLMGH